MLTYSRVVCTSIYWNITTWLKGIINYTSQNDVARYFFKKCIGYVYWDENKVIYPFHILQSKWIEKKIVSGQRFVEHIVMTYWNESKVVYYRWCGMIQVPNIVSNRFFYQGGCYFVNQFSRNFLRFSNGLVWAAYSGPLFTKGTDVLPQDLAKSRSREILVQTFTIALKFDRHIGSKAAEMPVEFQSDTIIITSNLATSRLHEIWR